MPGLRTLSPGDVGMPVYVPKGACPGDVTRCQITKVKRKKGDAEKCYAEAVFVERLVQSEHAVDVPCKHFGNFRLGGGGCGGCSSMQIPYALQVQLKQAQMDNLFAKFCRDGLVVQEVLECERTLHYRNKMEFSFGRRWYEKGAEPDAKRLEGAGGYEYALGLHAPQRFDKVIKIEECFIQEAVCNLILRHIAERYETFLLEPYDAKLGEGYMRSVMLRTAKNCEGKLEVMVNLVTSPCDVPERLVPLALDVKERFPEVVCVVQNISGLKGTHIIEEGLERLLAGERGYIEQKLCGINFRISSNSFFQTNAEQSQVLYEEVRKAAKLTKEDTLLDLFCGTGTIGLSLSAKAGKVVGFDLSRSAIDDARMNARLNGITNAVFQQGNLEKLSSVVNNADFSEADVIIVDPPRAGLHPGLVRFLAACDTKRIVYVSCNPVSQVRDIGMIQSMVPGKFRMTSVQPVDMFPHTPHIECIVSMERQWRS